MPVDFIARHDVKWFVASITQEQCAGKGAIFRVILNALAAEQYFANCVLLKPALGEFLQNVFAPLNSFILHGGAQEIEIERFHSRCEC